LGPRGPKGRKSEPKAESGGWVLGEGPQTHFGHRRAQKMHQRPPWESWAPLGLLKGPGAHDSGNHRPHGTFEGRGISPHQPPPQSTPLMGVHFQKSFWGATSPSLPSCTFPFLPFPFSPRPPRFPFLSHPSTITSFPFPSFLPLLDQLSSCFALLISSLFLPIPQPVRGSGKARYAPHSDCAQNAVAQPTCIEVDPPSNVEMQNLAQSAVAKNSSGIKRLTFLARSWG